MGNGFRNGGSIAFEGKGDVVEWTAVQFAHGMHHARHTAREMSMDDD